MRGYEGIRVVANWVENGAILSFHFHVGLLSNRQGVQVGVVKK